MSENDQAEGINLSLDALIAQVKKEFKIWVGKRRDLIIMLGNKLLENRFRKEDICEEIKSILHEEIIKKEISRRDIERHCPDNWKKRTKPKKKENENENDNPSFSAQNDQIPKIIIDTRGRAISDFQSQQEPTYDKHVEVAANNVAESADNRSDLTMSKTEKINIKLPFQLSFSYDILQEYMAKEFNNNKGTKRIWIHGIIDITTGKILYANLGRSDTKQNLL